MFLLDFSFIGINMVRSVTEKEREIKRKTQYVRKFRKSIGFEERTSNFLNRLRRDMKYNHRFVLKSNTLRVV
jgi:hypothetical protein